MVDAGRAHGDNAGNTGNQFNAGMKGYTMELRLQVDIPLLDKEGKKNGMYTIWRTLTDTEEFVPMLGMFVECRGWRGEKQRDCPTIVRIRTSLDGDSGPVTTVVLEDHCAIDSDRIDSVIDAYRASRWYRPGDEA